MKSGMPLRKYRDFWTDCRRHPAEILKRAKFLRRTNPNNLEMKGLLEIYQDTLELDKSLIISDNGNFFFNNKLI